MNPDCEAILRIEVLGPAGQSRDFDAVIDTGFNGEISLEPAAIASLGLPYYGTEIAELAGKLVTVRRYYGRVLWDGIARDVIVLEMDGEPLLGMALLDHMHLGIDVVAGGCVTITPLP